MNLDSGFLKKQCLLGVSLEYASTLIGKQGQCKQKRSPRSTFSKPSLDATSRVTSLSWASSPVTSLSTSATAMSDRTAAGVAKVRHLESLAEQPLVEDPKLDREGVGGAVFGVDSEGFLRGFGVFTGVFWVVLRGFWGVYRSRWSCGFYGHDVQISGCFSQVCSVLLPGCQLGESAWAPGDEMVI